MFIHIVTYHAPNKRDIIEAFSTTEKADAFFERILKRIVPEDTTVSQFEDYMERLYYHHDDTELTITTVRVK